MKIATRAAATLARLFGGFLALPVRAAESKSTFVVSARVTDACSIAVDSSLWQESQSVRATCTSGVKVTASIASSGVTTVEVDGASYPARVVSSLAAKSRR